MKELIKSNKLGKIYKCRIFYGNGTSLLVKKSKWRDKEMGVLTDIGSHLLDICLFWFGTKIKLLKVVEINKFENKAPDQVTILLEINKIKIELEMTLCMWKNTFTCDLIASKGSAHLDSLCKWSKSTFCYRKRKFPSAKPHEKIISVKQGDPTWKREYLFFKSLIKNKTKASFKKDLILNNCFHRLNKSLV
jgi:predicted dehydrogenase